MRNNVYDKIEWRAVSWVLCCSAELHSSYIALHLVYAIWWQKTKHTYRLFHSLNNSARNVRLYKNFLNLQAVQFSVYITIII